MAKNKKRHGGRGGFKLPMAVVAGMSVPLITSYNKAKTWGWSSQSEFSGMATLIGSITGYNPWAEGTETSPKFAFNRMKQGLLPIIVGVGVHKIAGLLGINRAIGRAGIPILRI